MSSRVDGVRPIRRGKVWLVGAGPGDPELLTVRAHRLLTTASVVAYDELVPAGVLALAPAAAERIPVGRRAGGCRHHEARIHPLIVERALEGKDVVRLKGGDPFVFGRGGEEAEELATARVPFEVVPGISAALGAAAAAGLPLTHRECAASVTLVTAHAGVAERELDVAPRRQRREQVELLEHEADASVPDLGQLIIGHPAHVLAGQLVGAGSERVQAAQDVHQRGLA